MHLCVYVYIYIYEHIFMSENIQQLAFIWNFLCEFSVRHIKTCRVLIIFYLFTLNFKYGIAAFGTSWYWHFQMLLNDTVNS